MKSERLYNDNKKNHWIPTYLRGGKVENLQFGNGMPAVDFVNELLAWVNNANLGEVRKKKYNHFITYYAVQALTKEIKKPKPAYQELINYIAWLSKKLKKPLPENVRNRIIAYSL